MMFTQLLFSDSLWYCNVTHLILSIIEQTQPLIGFQNQIKLTNSKNKIKPFGKQNKTLITANT